MTTSQQIGPTVLHTLTPLGAALLRRALEAVVPQGSGSGSG